MSKRNKIESKRAAMLARVRSRIAEVERSYSDALIEPRPPGMRPELACNPNNPKGKLNKWLRSSLFVLALKLASN